MWVLKNPNAESKQRLLERPTGWRLDDRGTEVELSKEEVYLYLLQIVRLAQASYLRGWTSFNEFEVTIVWRIRRNIHPFPQRKLCICHSYATSSYAGSSVFYEYFSVFVIKSTNGWIITLNVLTQSMLTRPVLRRCIVNLLQIVAKIYDFCMSFSLSVF